MVVGRFLGMVGALIWDPSQDRYLILKRSAKKDFAKNIWECGTGRVDQGETFTSALLREMKEELDIELHIDFIIGTTHFYRGEKVADNEMLGIYYACRLVEGEVIKLSWEHIEYRWVSIDEAESLLSRKNWLVRLMKRANSIRLLMPDNLIQFNQDFGFEC